MFIRVHLAKMTSAAIKLSAIVEVSCIEYEGRDYYGTQPKNLALFWEPFSIFSIMGDLGKCVLPNMRGVTQNPTLRTSS